MRVEVVERKGETLKFILHGVATSFANALRRIMIAEVPNMTIDDVFILENSSILDDEALAHRLGLIPLTTDLDSYVLPEKCECESELGCDQCRVVLTLEARAEGEVRTVYSGELRSEDPKTHPVSDKIPITELAPGQSLKLEAYARLGLGKVHAKWQPVSECVYQNLPRIEIDRDRCDLSGNCVKACPREVFAILDGKLTVKDLLNCFLCGFCEEACPQDPPAVRARGVKDSFLYTIESTGALPPERIVTEAARVLAEKMEEFMEELGRLGEEPERDVEDEEEEKDEP
ncbi:MAG: DNA-directed RNA polymerase subunit D [Candidatus Bathyarchaeia archaeon]